MAKSYFKETINEYFASSQKTVSTATLLIRSISFTEMHVWVTGNGVTSTENRNESPSFDKKEPSQEKLTSQR